MSRTITLITTPSTSTEIAQEAVDHLKELGLIVEHQTFPENFSEWFPCPAVREESGRMICGIGGILTFVRDEQRR